MAGFAKATDDAGWVWTTKARDCFQVFPFQEALTAQAFLAP